jgi:ABC-type glycerol-3-phosphate transport system permease component
MSSVTSRARLHKPDDQDQQAQAAPRRFDLSRLPMHLILLFAAALVMLPAYFMVITSLKTQEEYGFSKAGFPQAIVLDNFEAALRGGRFFTWFGNSLIMTGGAVLLAGVISVLAAYAFARMRFPGRNVLLLIITGLMVIPPVVMIVPIFLMLSRFNLTSTYQGAIIVYAGLLAPFSVYLLTNFFRTIPHEILEAGLMDGATPLAILWRIVLPLSGPALITMVVVNALWVWNDLLVALVLLPKDDLRTLMVGITVFGARFNSDVPVAMAGMLLASVPMIVLYLLGQRYFIRGLVAGAIKE